MSAKLMSMREAVGRFIPDGARVAIGLCLESMIPFAAGHELIRQRRRNLHLIGPISDILFDQLIGAGCVRTVEAAWVGNVSAGLAHAYRRATEQGVPHPIQVIDHSNFTISLGLQAAALGVPYLPTRSLLGSDLARSQAYEPIEWHGEPLLAVKAIRPDVAVVAVQRADADGNAHAWGNLGVAEEAIMAAEHVILVAEEIVGRDVILSDPNRVLAPAFKVKAVVHSPGACHPSPVQGRYRRDHAFYHEYHQATRTPEGLQAWLQEWVDGLADRAAYLQKLGPDRWNQLTAVRSAPAAPVDYGW